VASRAPRKRAKISAERAALVEQLDLAGREVSAVAVAFHTQLAAHRGLTAIEEKALDILLRDGPMTHAELVDRVGLARPSVSNLIDRLAGKGYVTRSPHPDDGRRVIITADEAKIGAELTPLFTGWARSLHQLYGTFTDDELRAVLRFLTEAASRQRALAGRLGSS
jgi:DNA-binding MarR family transcriptional regulator